MFKITLHITARCPNHRRYNPERDGLAFRSTCSGCQLAYTTYQKVMELRRFLATGIDGKELITMAAELWNHGSTTCANPTCGKDLITVNPIYTIKGGTDGYCSQACRATVTHELIRKTPSAPDAGVVPVAPAVPEVTTKGKKKGKEAPAAPPKKAAPGQAPVPKTSKLATGTLHITGKHEFGGQRAIVMAMIKEGMTLQALYDQCAKGGLNGKSVLAKIIQVGKCVEIV